MITTAEWGANQSKDATRDSHPIGDTLGVTVHWTGTGYGWPWAHSRCFELVRDIERSHEYGNGWGDIAYNLLPCPHGHIFEGRGVGVRSAANGTTQANADWYAVCYLGGQGDDFTPEGQQAVADAVRLLRDAGAGPVVNGHRDHKATLCPGPTIYRWLQTASFDTGKDVLDVDEKQLRRIIREEVNRGAVWRTEELVRELVRRVPGRSPAAVIAAARARRKAASK